MRFKQSVFFCWLFAWLLSSTAFAQLHDNFFDEIVDANFTRPVGISFDENGRGYVWEQGGKVFVLTPEGDKLPTPLIDISEEVANFGDHGLLGFALDPNFYTNGYFYLAYIVDRHHLLYHGTADYNPAVTVLNEATIGRVTRYQADVNTDYLTTIAESRQVLLGETKETGIPVLMISHGMGTLAFGEDGSLLLSAGEAASFQSADLGSAPETYYAQALEDGILKVDENIGSFRAQLLNTHLGKILRIDAKTGDGLPSNPFYDATNPRSPKSRVWALGCRNPYRFIVKTNTGAHTQDLGQPGHLFIGDVGANLWEEVSVATKAAQNMGWPLYEGYFEKWPYHWEYIDNTEAANPLYQTADCDKAFFSYNDVLKNPIASGEIEFNNPCNPAQAIPATIPTYVHNRPILAWSNVSWNQPTRAYTPSFDAAGLASTIELDSSLSVVEGANFDGYSSLPGFFYEGDLLPDEFQGNLFLADYAGWIKAIQLDENYQVVKETTIQGDCKGITHLAYNSFDGAIYYTNLEDQKVHRISYSGTPPPVVQINVNQSFGASPLTVLFKGENSYSPFGSPLDFFWEFGDGNTSTDMNPSHIFVSPTALPTPYVSKLTVTDSTGRSRSQEVLITLNNTPPVVEITSFEDGDFYPVNGITNLPLLARVSDAEHTGLELEYVWTTYLHHNIHFHPEASNYAPQSMTLIEPLGCQEETFWYRIELKVTDSAGMSTTDSHELFPYCGPPFVDFIDLQGRSSSKNIILTWQSTFQDNVSHFEVQKKRSNTLYEPIGTVQANNTDAYTFVDKEGILASNTYRIRAINANGVYLYSNELTYFLNINEAIRIYPNPSQDVVYLTIKEALTNRIRMDLFDSIGRLVTKESWEATPNMLFQQSYQTTKLSAGIYFYQIQNGENTHFGKLIVRSE